MARWVKEKAYSADTSNLNAASREIKAGINCGKWKQELKQRPQSTKMLAGSLPLA